MNKGFPRAKRKLTAKERKWRTVPGLIVAGVVLYALYSTMTHAPEKAKAAAPVAHQTQATPKYRAPAPAMSPQSLLVSAPTMAGQVKAVAPKAGELDPAQRAQARWMAMLQEESKKQAQVMQRLDETHYSDPAKLTTPDEVLAALEAVNEYEKVCRRLESIVREAPATMRLYLAEEGADQDTIDGILRGMSGDVRSGLALREAETALALGVQGKMNFLRDEWGNWSVSQGGEVTFKHEGMFERFTRLCDDVDAAHQKEEQLARQVLTAQR
jgi:hypothetical protein